MKSLNNVHHLLDIDDLSSVEFADILNTGLEFASRAAKQEKFTSLGRPLENKGIALLFEKASVRTRHSMEMAVAHLGGHPISMQANEMGMGNRESVGDITKTLAGYHFAIGARVFSHSTLAEMAKVSPVPIFNMLSDKAHPLQALADFVTIAQTFDGLENLKDLKLAFVGDANNVAHSLALAANYAGTQFHIAHPEGYGFSGNILASDTAEANQTPKVIATQDPIAAVQNADVVYTDVWASMGQEKEFRKRQKMFQNFSVTPELMKHAKPNAIFLHCLPAYREQEVSSQVIDGDQSRVWLQAQNRMFAAMAYLYWLATKRV